VKKVEKAVEAARKPYVTSDQCIDYDKDRWTESFDRTLFGHPSCTLQPLAPIFARKK
jgi:hypothetical protein